VYDVTNAQSFASCAKWVELLADSFGHRKLKGIVAPPLPHPAFVMHEEEYVLSLTVRAAFAPHLDLTHFDLCILMVPDCVHHRYSHIYIYIRLHVSGALVGCKADLADAVAVNPNQARDFASEHGLQHFECSAVCIPGPAS
jgi:hypothetical protein